jgi:hypothetical protein
MRAVRQKRWGDLLARRFEGFPGTIILLGALAVKLNPEILDALILELCKDGARFEILAVCHRYSLLETGNTPMRIIPSAWE